LLNKRFFGWLSWRIRRRHVHQQPVLDAMFADLHDQCPDHIAITGDLTNVALEQEFVRASELLKRLGTPDRLSLVPGNHDAYVRVPMDRSWERWREYIRSDAEAGGAAEGELPLPECFPSLRIRGPVAFVGVCSSLPTPYFHATGTVGSEQLTRLESLLANLRERDLFRVVLIHHPLTHEGISPRRQLTDGPEVEALLERVGADLVLHGHRHRTMIRHVKGPDGEIPVIGVRSSSDVGATEEKSAQYHLYRFDTASGAKRGVSLERRAYDRDSGSFVDLDERGL
jgi:3',5'-cyclic AMP phosphodiesterase CpdA